MDSRDVVIIGGGPAGYAAAIRVARLGGKATLIERDTPGGTCISRGCIPVRALVRAAELIDMGKSARDYGVNYGEPTIDLARMMARKDTVVKTVVSGVKLLLEGNSVEVLGGAASFASPAEIDVTLTDGTSRRLSPRKTIIATGSRCRQPDGASGKVINTDEALGLKEVPASLVIVGGGFVGMALATIFSRLGSKVTVVTEADRLLPEIDSEIVSTFEKELKRNKIAIVSEGEQPGSQADITVIAENRQPNVEDIGLDRTGVRLSPKGGISVNSHMETNIPGILAAGDVTAENMWTHVAYAEGIVAAENAMGHTSTMDYMVVPWCANTLPEVAGVGLTEEKAIGEGYNVKIGRFPFAANATATIMGQRTGMLKLITDEKYGQILGAHVIGPQASALISEISLAMKLEATPRDIGSLMHTHPSLSEICWEAARDVNNDALHFLKG